MNTLFDLLDALAAHGPTILLGASVLLLAGCVAMRWTSHGAERRRLGVWTGAAVGIYLLVAFVPMQRWQVSFEVTDPAPAPEPALAAELLASTADATPPVDPQVRLAALQAQVERILDAEPIETTDAGAPIPPPKNEPVTSTPWPFRRLAAGAYVLAAVLMLLRHALGFHRLHRLLRRCQPAPAALRHGLPLPKLARVLVAEHAVRPFCAGWRRPVIVLPRTLLEPHRRSQARAVLRHEAAHLQAGDPAVQMLFALLAIPLGLHPLFWWLVRDVRFQCELLADDTAAAADRADYARELIDLAERAAPALQAVGTVSVLHRPSDFYRRMQMLLQREGRLIPSSSRLRRTAQAVAALLCVSVAASVLGVPLRAQDPTPESALRQQNDKLRAELDALRAEIQNLREAVTNTSGVLGRLNDGPSGAEQGRASLERIPDLRAILENADGLVGRLIVDPSTGDRLRSILQKLNEDAKATDGTVDEATWNEFAKRLDASRTQWESHRRTGQDNATPRTYTIKTGDSLRTIAKQLLGSADRVDELMAANPGVDWTRLRVGQTVGLPTGKETPPGIVELTAPKEPQDDLVGELQARTIRAALEQRRAANNSNAKAPETQDPQPEGVPVLKDIPLINNLFRDNANGNATSNANRTAPATTAEATAEQNPEPRQFFFSEPDVFFRGPDGKLRPQLGLPKEDRTAPSATAETTADLASRFLDLQGELEVAELTASEVESMAKAGRAMMSEAKRATSKRDTLQKKLAIVRCLIDGEIQATESELKWLERKLKESDKYERLQIDAQIQRAKVRLEVLRSVK